MENMEHFLQDYYHKEILTHYTFTKISNTFSKLQPNNFIEQLKIGKEILPLLSEVLEVVVVRGKWNRKLNTSNFFSNNPKLSYNLS